jgi:Ca2+-binding RTX toxin-like protein
VARDPAVRRGRAADRRVRRGAAALNSALENLTLIGANAVSATGNSANNVLSGGLGADTLSGGAGNDVYQYRFVAESTATSKDHRSGTGRRPRPGS